MTHVKLWGKCRGKATTDCLTSSASTSTAPCPSSQQPHLKRNLLIAIAVCPPGSHLAFIATFLGLPRSTANRGENGSFNRNCLSSTVTIQRILEVPRRPHRCGDGSFEFSSEYFQSRRQIRGRSKFCTLVAHLPSRPFPDQAVPNQMKDPFSVR